MSKDLQGFEEYTPSRLEWLVVILNSYTAAIERPEGVQFGYTVGSNANTITLYIVYDSAFPQESVKYIENVYKEFALKVVESYNWDSWLKIQTQLTELKPTDRPPSPPPYIL